MSEQEPDSTDQHHAALEYNSEYNIEVLNNSALCTDTHINWMTDRLYQVLDLLKLPAANLSLVMVDDEQMSTLHLQFSNVPGTTDVLTFDLTENKPTIDTLPELVDGEIIICVDEANRRATELNHPLENELLLYAVHGVLHLLGYDDHDPADHQLMHETEDKLLSAIGVGAIFKPQNPHSFSNGD